MELVLATTNLHKLREFRAILSETKELDLISLKAFPDYVQPEEIGSSLQQIAELKALHAAKALNRLVLADDSGLIVPILGGGPGIHSRYYAGKDATDSQNRSKLLVALAGKTELERAAYFECALSLAGPDGIIKTVTGRCEGLIALEEKGGEGFGYDSLFIKHDYDKTFAELGDSIKNRISHRRKALDALAPYLT